MTDHPRLLLLPRLRPRPRPRLRKRHRVLDQVRQERFGEARPSSLKPTKPLDRGESKSTSIERQREDDGKEGTWPPFEDDEPNALLTYSSVPWPELRRLTDPERLGPNDDDGPMTPQPIHQGLSGWKPDN